MNGVPISINPKRSTWKLTIATKKIWSKDALASDNLKILIYL